MKCPTQSVRQKKGSDNFFLYFLFYSVPLRGAIYFTQSIGSNVNLIQKDPHRHAQKYCLIWAPHSHSNSHKINYHLLFSFSMFLKSQATSLNKCFLSISFFLSCHRPASKPISVESKLKNKATIFA